MTPPEGRSGSAGAEAAAERAEDGAAAAQQPLPDAYLIPRALAQATLEYLAAQPYREVFALIRGFESLEPAPDDATRDGR